MSTAFDRGRVDPIRRRIRRWPTLMWGLSAKRSARVDRSRSYRPLLTPATLDESATDNWPSR